MRLHLQLLLLLALGVFGLHAGPFSNQHMISPKSYLDVLRPASQQDFSPAAVTSSQPSGASRGPGLLTAVSRAANPARLAPPYVVCVSSWAPMVRCIPAADQSEYQGYQIELFRMAAAEAGWAEGDYAFECMDYSAMMADLNDPAGNCSLTAAGVEVSPANLAAGLKFTWPTYKSGLRIMISAHLQTGSTWAFSEIFSWQVWLLLGASGVAVGLMAGALEVLNRIDMPGAHMPSRRNWQAWLWYILAKLFHVTPHVGDPTSDATRVLTLGYGFLVLVMVSMYTAVAASRMTAAALVHPVHSQKDLVGANPKYKTLTWLQYQTKLKDHQGIYADGELWEREGDLDHMIEHLRSGVYSALVLDAPILEYTAGTNEECDLFLVGEVFESFSIAFAFPTAFDDATIYAFSKAIVSLQTYQGALDMLENVYIKTGGTDKCFGSDSGGHGSGETILLEQVSGLWYILCITVGLCMILTLMHNIRKDPNKMAKVRRFGSFMSSNGTRHSAGSDKQDPQQANGTDTVQAFSGPAGSPRVSFPQEKQDAGSPQQPKTRAPSTLRVFLGTQSVNRRVSDSEEESESPNSPKKMPRISQLGHQPN